MSFSSASDVAPIINTVIMLKCVMKFLPMKNLGCIGEFLNEYNNCMHDVLP